MTTTTKILLPLALLLILTGGLLWAGVSKEREPMSPLVKPLQNSNIVWKVEEWVVYDDNQWEKTAQYWFNDPTEIRWLNYPTSSPTSTPVESGKVLETCITWPHHAEVCATPTPTNPGWERVPDNKIQ